MIFDGVWWCLKMSEDVWWCLMIFDDMYLMMFEDVWWCLKMFDDVWWYLMMFYQVFGEKCKKSTKSKIWEKCGQDVTQRWQSPKRTNFYKHVNDVHRA